MKLGAGLGTEGWEPQGREPFLPHESAAGMNGGQKTREARKGGRAPGVCAVCAGARKGLRGGRTSSAAAAQDTERSWTGGSEFLPRIVLQALWLCSAKVQGGERRLDLNLFAMWSLPSAVKIRGAPEPAAKSSEVWRAAGKARSRFAQQDRPDSPPCVPPRAPRRP